jgi:hypothetical protein
MAARGFFTSWARRAATAFERARSILALAAELLAARGELERDALVGRGDVQSEPRNREEREAERSERDDEVFRARPPVMRRERGGKIADRRAGEERQCSETHGAKAEEHGPLKSARQRDRRRREDRQPKQEQRACESPGVPHGDHQRQKAKKESEK